jgi:hypothetical protein
LCCLTLLGALPSAWAAPPGAIPFYCYEGVGIGFEAVISCRRADTRALFSTVPAGMVLHVTDIVMDPNNASTTGTLSALIGRDDTTAFPDDPSVGLLGFPTQSLHFTTPHIVLRAGESLSIAAFAASTAPIDVRVSGYLAATASP